MKGKTITGIAVAEIVYILLFVLAASSGAIHPACYAYVGTFIPLLFAFVYLYVSANMKCFGSALLLNGILLLAALIAGEGNTALIILLLVLTAAAEVIRYFVGYGSLKGVRLSFIPFAFSFYAYSAHWWTETEESLAEALVEMPLGYANKMAKVIDNVPVLIIMLILTIPVAILAMRLAEKALKKQALLLESGK